MLFSSESKSFCRIRGADASGASLTRTVGFDMTLPRHDLAAGVSMNSFQRPSVETVGDVPVKSFSVGKTHSVSQVTCLFWARLKGAVRHISHQPVIRANSLYTHTSTWRCSEAMRCRHASGCDGKFLVVWIKRFVGVWRDEENKEAVLSLVCVCVCVLLCLCTMVF